MKVTYYLRPVAGHPLQLWQIEPDRAFMAGATSPETSIVGYYIAESGESIWDTLRRKVPFWFEPNNECPFFKTALEPGQYYPRMARPTNANPGNAPGLSPSASVENEVVAIARGQLTALVRQLERICQVVHPYGDSLRVYGHDIRNLLVLACMEVESHLRGILIANGMSSKKKKRYDMNDYVILRDVMKLDQYSLAFPNFPWLSSISPFNGWGHTGKPSQDLMWYDAYNAVKHNRETEFYAATLDNALSAVAACAILMAAQFGLETAFPSATELASFFQLTAVPSWALTEIYVYPVGSIPEFPDLVPVIWSPADFPF
jgi:hypothetical protein